MNDPGLEDAVPEAFDPVEKEKDGGEEVEEQLKHEREGDQEYDQANRWWFASTANPLIAGTFGPIANTFSIFALIEHWRISTPPGLTDDNGIDVPDPKWLLAINGVSLAFAIIANTSLLLNMAKRLSFSIAQPITVLGFFTAFFLLVGIIIPASMIKSGDQVMTQGFYYAVMAAGIYFFIGVLMAVTVWGAFRGHFSREFQLTMSQRTLMLQTMSYLVYLMAGAGVYSKIEGWPYLDAVYWANTTLLTIGLGDFTPQTHLGRSLLFPYAIGGIITLGLVIGSIRSLVLDRGKKKLSARIVEKQRVRILTGLREQHKTIPSLAHRLKDKMLFTDSERERRKAEFHLMRVIQRTAANDRRWMSLSISSAAWFFLWFIGSVVFWKSEVNQDWTYFVSVYFSYTSLLTIGYGEPYPISNAGKSFYVLWSLMAVPTLTILISNMGDTVIKGIRDVTIWIGEWTVLPGQNGFKASLRRGLHAIIPGKQKHWKELEDEDNHTDPVKEVPPGIFGDAPEEDEGADEEGRAQESDNPSSYNSESPDDRSKAHLPRNSDPTKSTERLEHDAENEPQDRNNSSRSEHGSHQRKGSGHSSRPDFDAKRNYLLAHEISLLTGLLTSNPSNKFTYKQWEYYLSLLGQDESSTVTHRDTILHLLTSKSEDKASKKEARREFKADADREYSWSWVGKGSPLMAHQTETEWLLEKLCSKLEHELKKHT
jgi:potassium channel subfamily K